MRTFPEVARNTCPTLSSLGQMRLQPKSFIPRNSELFAPSWQPDEAGIIVRTVSASSCNPDDSSPEPQRQSPFGSLADWLSGNWLSEDRPQRFSRSRDEWCAIHMTTNVVPL